MLAGALLYSLDFPCQPKTQTRNLPKNGMAQTEAVTCSASSVTPNHPLLSSTLASLFFSFFFLILIPPSLKPRMQCLFKKRTG